MEERNHTKIKRFQEEETRSLILETKKSCPLWLDSHPVADGIACPIVAEYNDLIIEKEKGCLPRSGPAVTGPRDASPNVYGMI
ncbi:hypothetical protein KDJ56_03675 [Brevibacillus composti]|uniref:Uncharacterized protein n=1 Tax=Brevibacillus composti TaxID=2796470 RepID=A0A7T5ELZ1_9BACL|nr:hypothetical protein [Brevibacillus composti]QQE75055.1 hypothetical protein JD108_03670 [Brevibacillus composti]QUO42141.1 hypothetical protein KDJ56_03675 [Brevibacillus composti]